MLAKLLILLYFSYVNASLDGPFVIWGPNDLVNYRKPALASLAQDELMQMYTGRKAIVVFKNLGAVPLNKDNFPRLRKALESRTTLSLSQYYLEVDPDYVSNDTLKLVLEGPNFERDAKVTETFKRLEDVYGVGNVLAILGSSQPKLFYDTNTADRVKRKADDESDESEKQEPTPSTPKSYALYNASEATIKALLYSSKWPVLRINESDEVIPLINQIGPVTVDTKNKGGRLGITFIHEDEKIILRIRFDLQNSAYWWMMTGVEIEDLRTNSKEKLFLLKPSSENSAPQAPIGKSYHCSRQLHFVGPKGSLTLTDIQFEPYMKSTRKFSGAFDCTGFMTVPIWSGIFVMSLMIIAQGISITMINDIKTMDKFDSTKGKSLNITVTD